MNKSPWRNITIDRLKLKEARKEAKRRKARERYQADRNDDTYREALNERQREYARKRYHEDSEFREKHKSRVLKRYHERKDTQ